MRLKEVGEFLGGLAVWAAIGFVAWSYCQPEPGYIRDPSSMLPWRHVWKPGSRSPDYPHIYAAEKAKHWQADPGYTFLSDGKLDVAWSPGVAHPSIGNIQAGRQREHWVPDPGYRFAEGREVSKRAEPVAWIEGIPHSTLPHLRSALKEKHWKTEPGYDFLVTGEKNDGTVRWLPNKAHPVSPFIRSDVVEGQWVANPGYRFPDTGTNRSSRPNDVRWVSGVAHPNCPKAIAADRPDLWRPADGYRFVSTDRLDVERIPSGLGNSMSGGEIVANVLLAIVANSLATPSNEDGIVTSAGRFVAKEVRDEATRNVIRGFSESPVSSSSETVLCDYWGGIPIGE